MTTRRYQPVYDTKILTLGFNFYMQDPSVKYEIEGTWDENEEELVEQIFSKLDPLFEDYHDYKLYFTGVHANRGAFLIEISVSKGDDFKLIKKTVQKMCRKALITYK